jgi:CRISPR-associated protein Cmr5
VTGPRETTPGQAAAGRQTPEQRRAADALRRVQELEIHDEAFRKAYRAYAERIGPSILMNGLGQALAAELAAAGDQQKADGKAHHRLYQSIEAWLCRAGGVYPEASNGRRDLLAAIIAGKESDYLRAQVEALAWLSWHKKFCRAYLPRGVGEGDRP